MLARRRGARHQRVQGYKAHARCPREQAARAPCPERCCGGGPAPDVARGHLTPAAEVAGAGGGGGVARRVARERLRLGRAHLVVPGLHAEEVVGDADHALLAQRACRAACRDGGGCKQPAGGSPRTVLLARCRAAACSRLWCLGVGRVRFQTLSTPIPYGGISGTLEGLRTSVPLSNLRGQRAPRCSAANGEQPGALLRERPARQRPSVSELEDTACPHRHRVRGYAAVAAVHWQCGGTHRPAAAGQHVCSLGTSQPHHSALPQLVGSAGAQR